MRASLSSMLQLLLGFCLLAVIVADPVPEPKSGTSKSSISKAGKKGSKIFRTDGFDDDDNDDDFDDYDNLDEYDGNIDSEDARDLCSSLVPSTTTIAGAAVTRTTYSTYICQTTATPTPTTASRSDDDDDDDEITTTSSIDSGAKPTGAVDTKFLMGIVGAGVGAAVLGF